MSSLVSVMLLAPTRPSRYWVLVTPIIGACPCRWPTSSDIAPLTLALADRGELVRQDLQLSQHAVVNLRSAAAFRQRVLRAVLPVKGPVRYHIGEERDALVAAVIQDASVLRAAVEEAIVVLNGFDPEPGFAEDLVGELDFAEVGIRDADMFDLPALQQRNEVRNSSRDIGWIVNPVEVDVVGAEVGEICSSMSGTGSSLVPAICGLNFVESW